MRVDYFEANFLEMNMKRLTNILGEIYVSSRTVPTSWKVLRWKKCGKLEMRTREGFLEDTIERDSHSKVLESGIFIPAKMLEVDMILIDELENFETNILNLIYSLRLSGYDLPIAYTGNVNGYFESLKLCSLPEIKAYKFNLSVVSRK